jgi:hypothetical protein
MGMAVRGQPPVMLPLGPTTRATEHGSGVGSALLGQRLVLPGYRSSTNKRSSWTPRPLLPANRCFA